MKIAGIIILFAVLTGCVQKKERYIDPLIWNLLEQKTTEKSDSKEEEK